jgi:acetyl esterase
MPNINNNNWMSLLVGQDVDPPLPKTVEEIPFTREAMDFSSLNVDLPEIANSETIEIRNRDGWKLLAEVYIPKGSGPFPVILYMHGGGWCIGSPEGVKRKAMRLAEQGFVVFNLNYSLAPERIFPNAVEDVVYAARWIVKNAHTYNGDAAKMIVSGDSAGANLSAVAIHVLHGDTNLVDGGDLSDVKVKFSGALLYYGVFDFPLMISEPLSNSGYVEVWFTRAYLGPNYLSKVQNPLVSPVFSPYLEKFPPCYLVCGDQDSLLSNTLSMTKALTSHNVPTTVSIPSGFDHTFDYVEHKLEGVTPEIERISTWLKSVTA